MTATSGFLYVSVFFKIIININWLGKGVQTFPQLDRNMKHKATNLIYFFLQRADLDGSGKLSVEECIKILQKYNVE